MNDEREIGVGSGRWHRQLTYVAEMTKEYIEHAALRTGTGMTCEFATTTEGLDAMKAALFAANELLCPINATWTIRPCATCQGHHSDDFWLHCEITGTDNV